MKKLLTIAIILLISTKCFSADLYVNSTGSNAAAGTAGAPWQTLLYASAQAVPGDTIWLQPGTYTENSQIVLAVRVSLKAVGDTNNTFVNTNFVSGAFLSLESATNGTDGQQVISGITFNGNNVGYRAAMIYLRSHVEVFNCKFLNFVHDGVHFKGLQNTDINVGNFWTHGLQHNGLIGNPVFSVGNKFYKNSMVNCAEHAGGYAYGSLNIGGQDSLLIYNNYITNVDRAFNLNGEPIKLQVDILGFIRHTRISNNILKAATVNPFVFDNQHFDFAIELFYCTDLEVDNNDIEGSIDINWQFPGDNYSVYIHNNNIHTPAHPSNGYTSGIVLEFDTYDAIVENNTINNCAQGIVFTTRAGCYIQNTIVRNNLITNMGIDTDGYPNGYSISNTPGYEGISLINFQILHNTVTTTTASGTTGAQYGLTFFGCDTVDNVNFSNNLLVGPFIDQTFRISPPAVVKNSFFRNNATYGGNYNNLFERWDGTPTLDLSNTKTGNFEGTQNPSLNGSYEVTNPVLINEGTDGLTIGYNAGADIAPPTVTSTNPTNGATGVPLGAYNIVITFDGAMNTSTLNGTNITGVAGAITAGSTYASIAATLAASTTYTITVAGVQDAAGNTIAAPYVFSFTTGAALVGGGSGKKIIPIIGKIL
jgi:parallel beta-helix repeat protein